MMSVSGSTLNQMPKRRMGASVETHVGLGPVSDTERLTLDFPPTGAEAWSEEEPGTELLDGSWRYSEWLALTAVPGAGSMPQR
jgi:hypothetical protein